MLQLSLTFIVGIERENLKNLVPIYIVLSNKEFPVFSILFSISVRAFISVGDPVGAVTRVLIGGGGEYSYICVLSDEFLLKSTLRTTDFKRNSSDRTQIYEYSPPPPPAHL